MPYWNELKYNDAEDIDGPGDVSLPSTMHHMQVKSELNMLLELGALDERGVEEAMRMWKAKSELGDVDKAEAAIDELEQSGVIDEEEASELRERATA